MSALLFFTHRFHEQQFRGASTHDRDWYLDGDQFVQHEMYSYHAWYDNKAKAITFTYKSYYFNDYSVLFTGVIHARYLPWAKLKISVSLFICSSLEADASFAGPLLHSRSDGTHGSGISSWMENIKKQPWLIQLQEKVSSLFRWTVLLCFTNTRLTGNSFIMEYDSFLFRG